MQGWKSKSDERKDGNTQEEYFLFPKKIKAKGK